MTHHIERNIVELWGKLNEFHVEGKYTDVTIECGDQSFKCHKVALAAASDVFDRMFSSSFIEKTAESIRLPEICPATFNGILQFIYTGDVPINSTNVIMLIEASEFFKLPGIQELCIEFLKNNRISVQSTLRMFVFACQTQKEVLMDILSWKIALQFEIFSKTRQLLDVSFIGFKIILKQLWLLPRCAINYDEVCNVIVKWVQHNREERLGLTDRIAEEIEFDRISPEYLKCLFKKILYDTPTPTPESSTITDTTSNDIEISESPMEKRLYVYVKYPARNLMNVFSVGSRSIENDNEYSAVLFSNVSSIGANQWIRSVTLHDHYIYCLNYLWMRRSEAIAYNQSFNLYTSVDLNSPTRLMPAPVFLDNVQLSLLDNNIYAYNRTLSSRRFAAAGLTEFSEEEISRGLYRFNCDVNNWFPVPAIPNRYRDSSMIACGDVLYMIGGLSGSPTNNSQAYDHRMGTWREIHNSINWHTGSDCCVMNNKIYVCGGRSSTVECYDPVAEKWNRLKSLPTIMQYHKVVSYKNNIWAMGNFVGGVPNDKLDVFIYNPILDSWNTSHILVDASRTNMDIVNGTVVDCIVY